MAVANPKQINVALYGPFGEGVGARVLIREAGSERYIGTLTFHERHDWQVTDSSQAGIWGWAPFDTALSLARERWPEGG